MKQKNKFLICEIGLNYLGNKKLINNYIDRLSQKKIYGITIQVLKSTFYTGKFAKYKLSNKFISKIISKIHQKKIKIGIATDDISRLDFFIEKNIDFYKVLSKDINNVDLINKIISSNKRIFLSTGKSDYRTIKHLLGKISQSDKIRLIHTSFDTALEGAKLERIEKLKNIFKIPISYGNHSPYLMNIPLSIIFNPEYIFTYVKLDNMQNYPDDNHAITIDMIDEILYSVKQIVK